MIRTSLPAKLPDGREESWIVEFTEEAPWSVRLISANGDVHAGNGADLFESLKKARRALDERGIALCCNGARPNARPSPRLSADGGFLLYVIPRGRPAGMQDVVPLFSPAPSSEVGTVAEQDRCWQELSRRTGLLWLINPVRLWKFMENTIRGPRCWMSEIGSDGFTTWHLTPARRGIR